MFIRMLAICGLLSVACPTFAQSYFDSHGYVASPLHDTGHHDWRSGHVLYPPAYAYHHLAPYTHSQDVYGDGVLPSCSGFDHQGFASHQGYYGGDVSGCNHASGCPLQRGNFYGPSAHHHEPLGGFHQHRSDQSAHDHAHDHHGQAHAEPRAPFTPHGDAGRLRELPNGQYAPQVQAPFPSDRQPLAPPSLPRASQPRQLEAPLGDGPPPSTVPLSSPRQLRTLDSKLLNI